MIPMTLETAKIKSLPDSAYYIPDFITAEEEERLLQKVGVKLLDWYSTRILCLYFFLLSV